MFGDDGQGNHDYDDNDDDDDDDDYAEVSPSYHSSPAPTEMETATYSTYHELQRASDAEKTKTNLQTSSSQNDTKPTSAQTELVDALEDTFVYYAIVAVNERARETCVGCQIDHPSQVQHMTGCLAESYDKITTHLPDVLDAALSLIFSKWVTSTWREEMREKVFKEHKATLPSAYYHSDVEMYN